MDRAKRAREYKDRPPKTALRRRDKQNTKMSELLNLAIKAAISAGGEIMKFYSSNSQALKVCLKDDSSPLTSADLAANEVILKRAKQKWDKKFALKRASCKIATKTSFG